MEPRYEAEQLQMPLLVAASGQPIPTRFDAFEDELLNRLKERSGLSKSELIRRAVQLIRVEVARHGGSPDFLVNPDRFDFPQRVKSVTSGRKPRGRKIAELKKNIASTLRALEQQRRELEALESREVRAA